MDYNQKLTKILLTLYTMFIGFLLVGPILIIFGVLMIVMIKIIEIL